MAAHEQDQRRARQGEMAVACECSDSSCHALIVLTIEEHDFIRKVPNRLVVLPGHADPKAERVLMAEPRRFEVVEPFGRDG